MHLTERCGAQALYSTPQEAPPYARNLAEHARVGAGIAHAILARRQAVMQHERQLAAQYRRLFEAWRVHITGARLPSRCDRL